MSQQDAVMALHLDAGPDRNKRPRVIYVVLDAGAHALAAVRTPQELESGYGKLPTFGPIDVKTGVWRRYLDLARQGNPKVYQRRNGRTERAEKPLTATLGSRSPNLRQMKRKLTGGPR